MTEWFNLTSKMIEALRTWFHPKDRSVVLGENCFIEFDILDTAPANPLPGRIRFYAKSNGTNELYMLESDGTETQVS
jgi:hypothetical protein